MSLMQPEAACPNCNEPITGQYCANCGQRVTQVRMSVRRILMDVLEDQFSLNSSLARTMKALFFKPGFLTTEYFSLRIARYAPPFRLYLIASLLFFLLLSFMASGSRIDVESTMSEARDSIAAAVARDSLNPSPGDTAVRFNVGVSRGPAEGVRFGVSTDPTLENWAEETEVNLGNERLNRAVKTRLLELGKLPPEEAFRRLIRGAIESTPKIMFLILPIYALLLKLLYVREKRLYVEHFIFALHLHAFAFLLFFITLALREVPYSGLLVWLWLPVYALLAMKRVYGQGWFKTTAKWATLGFAYMIVLSFGVLAAFVGALFGV